MEHEARGRCYRLFCRWQEPVSDFMNAVCLPAPPWCLLPPPRTSVTSQILYAELRDLEWTISCMGIEAVSLLKPGTRDFLMVSVFLKVLALVFTHLVRCCTCRWLLWGFGMWRRCTTWIWGGKRWRRQWPTHSKENLQQRRLGERQTPEVHQGSGRATLVFQ